MESEGDGDINNGALGTVTKRFEEKKDWRNWKSEEESRPYRLQH